MHNGIEFFNRLLRHLGRTQPEEYDCDQVHQVLDEFAEAARRGEDVAARLPLVQQHLEMCPDCWEEFQALLRSLDIQPV
jgi:hypothetical protein